MTRKVNEEGSERMSILGSCALCGTVRLSSDVGWWSMTPSGMQVCVQCVLTALNDQMIKRLTQQNRRVVSPVSEMKIIPHGEVEDGRKIENLKELNDLNTRMSQAELEMRRLSKEVMEMKRSVEASIKTLKCRRTDETSERSTPSDIMKIKKERLERKTLSSMMPSTVKKPKDWTVRACAVRVLRNKDFSFKELSERITLMRGHETNNSSLSAILAEYDDFVFNRKTWKWSLSQRSLSL